MSSTPRNRFTGVPTTGIFESQRNSVFFSPALLDPRSGNEIEVQSVSLKLVTNDAYRQPTESDTRFFRVGSLTTSRTNNSLYRSVYKYPSVIGNLVQIIPPGPTTVFKVR